MLFVTHSIAEAVFLSSRIVVMTARPGRIQKIIDVDLPYPRSPETRESERFFQLTTEVREALRLGQAAATVAVKGPEGGPGERWGRRGAMSWLRRAWPVIAVMLATVALGYPIALLFGLPLARQRMHDLSNWVTATSVAQPVAEVPNGRNQPERSMPPRRTACWCVTALRWLPATSKTGRPCVSRARWRVPWCGWARARGPARRRPPGVPPARRRRRRGAALPRRKLLHAGAADSVERADGRATTFTFDDASGPIVVGDRVLVPGRDYQAKGDKVTFAQAPPFNAEVRRITGDYAVLDPAKGLVALARPASVRPRVGQDAVRLAERLSGAVDGSNRTFTFAHAPVVDTDPSRQVYVDGTALSSTPERPGERVDGQRARFTFASSRGLVTVDGQLHEPRKPVHARRAGRHLRHAAPAQRLAAAIPRLSSSATCARASSRWPRRRDRGAWCGPPTTPTTRTPPAAARCCSASTACRNTRCPSPTGSPRASRPSSVTTPSPTRATSCAAVLYTSAGTLSALLLGGAFGVLLAVLFVFLRPLEQALLPWVIASQTVPIIALVPVLLLVLGNVGITVQTSLIPTALIGAYIAFFPVTVGPSPACARSTRWRSTSCRATPPARSRCSSRCASPPPCRSCSPASSWAPPRPWSGALVAETESNNRRGLGYAIIGQVQAGNVADVWILLLVSAALGIGLVALVGAGAAPHRARGSGA